VSGGNTLFRRTVITLGLSLLAYSLFALLIINYYILHPMVERGADDLAALMTLAAKTWVELPPKTRPDFEHELMLNHGLRLGESKQQGDTTTPAHPYYSHLEKSLRWRTDTTIQLSASTIDNQRWIWADIPAGGKNLKVGFNANRIGQFPLAFSLVLTGGVVVLVLTTLILVPRLTRPIEGLVEAVQRFGRSSKPRPIAEKGPKELVDLARTFNRMQEEISELLANRTTLLAGISHDLRTPLARMRLAIEMLTASPDRELIDGIYQDLDEMEHLITQTLALARDISPEPNQTIDLPDLVDGVIADARRSGLNIKWNPNRSCPCDTAPKALRRVLLNLLENAERYGEGKPVTVSFDCDGSHAQIQIRDRGPGIRPQDLVRVMQPFKRLESSRSRSTGGSGLGLAIVHQLCRIQGWDITLENAPDGGLQATLLIPIE
jgi:two-component system osmolarity sensor histidine kinase EnvZ